MLEANTDRMWFTIGSILIGAALVMLSKDGLSTAMGSINDVFSGETDVMAGVVAEAARAQRTPQPNLLTRNLNSYGPYHSSANWLDEDSFEITWRSATVDYITFQKQGGTTFVKESGDHTLSGYVLLNGKPAPKSFWAMPKQITSYHRGETIDPEALFQYNSETGFFSMTQHYPDTSKMWTVHTRVRAVKDDILTFKELKFEKGSKPTPYTGVQ